MCSANYLDCPNLCQNCGSDEWLIEGDKLDVFLAEAILLDQTLFPFQYTDMLYLCDGQNYIRIEAEADNEGNCSGNATYTHQNEKKKTSFEGSVTVERDSEGRTTASGKISAEWGF